MVLKDGILQCDRYNDEPTCCHFSLTLKTTESEEEEGSGMMYVAGMNGCRHAHALDPVITIRHLKPEMHAEAFHMTNELHIGFRDTLRFLEDTYGWIINPFFARKKLKYA